MEIKIILLPGIHVHVDRQISIFKFCIIFIIVYIHHKNKENQKLYSLH